MDAFQKGQEKVALRPVPWSGEAEQALAGADGASKAYTMADLAREVQTGSATLYAVYQGAARLGFVVLWFDNFGGTKELVIQSGRAFANERRAVALALPVIEQFARAAGCVGMRTHSNDSPMMGHLKRYGFKKSEIVLRKDWA